MTTSWLDLIEIVLLSGIYRDTVLTALIDDLDFLGAVRVVEANRMATARFDQAHIILRELVSGGLSSPFQSAPRI